MKQKIVIIFTAFSLVLSGCTKLNEELRGEINPSTSAGSANVPALLQSVYNSLRDPFQGEGNLFALTEMSTDAVIGPTRGGDWDDNGAWRVLHNHRFDG